MTSGVYVRVKPVWNKNKVGVQKSWSKGLNKDNCISLKLLGEKTSLTKREKFSSEEYKNNYLKNNKTLFKKGNIPINPVKKGQHISEGTEFKKGNIPFNFNNYSSFEPYTKEFNKEFKLAIRQREGFLCLKCGMREEDVIQLFKRKLDIHHIDYNKENSLKENCCALCQRCHTETNYNRPSWTKFFQSLLSEIYEYEYSEDGKIIIKLQEVKNG